MVRGIVGTLLNIGSGKLPPHSMEEILTSKKRIKAGITAPAHGLFLHHILY
jgi:tRNA pseudouridine38-40 synthase